MHPRPGFRFAVALPGKTDWANRSGDHAWIGKVAACATPADMPRPSWNRAIPFHFAQPLVEAVPPSANAPYSMNESNPSESIVCLSMKIVLIFLTAGESSKNEKTFSHSPNCRANGFLGRAGGHK